MASNIRLNHQEQFEEVENEDILTGSVAPLANAKARFNPFTFSFDPAAAATPAASSSAAAATLTLKSNGEGQESPETMLTRLLAETEALTAYIDHASPTHGQPTQEQSTENKTWEEPLRLLQHKLKGLQEKIRPTVPETTSHIAEDSLALKNLLTTHLQTQDERPSAASTAEASTSAVVYELHSIPESSEKAEVRALEERLAALERTVGIATTPVTISNNHYLGRRAISDKMADNSSLTAAVQETSARLQVLTAPGYLDNIVKRLRIITQDAAKVSKVGDTDTQVKALHDLLPTVQSLAPLAPLLLERLQTLQKTHQRAETVVAAVEELEEDARSTRKILASAEEALKRVEDHWAENLQTIWQQLPKA